jgi:serine/threonine-protein kinase
MGTPLYMSPEQVEARPLDPRSDIYSLGVTAYQMLAGEPPFRGETALGIAVQHLKTPPPRLENARPDLPAALGRIVGKMLAKDPNQRYATARELLRELRAVSLELFPQEAGEELEAWSDGELAGAVEARRLATERLGTAMKTTAMPAVQQRRAWWRWVALAVGGFLLGTAAAYAVRPRALITPDAEADVVPHYQSAAQQYLYAMMVDSEAGWNAVAQNFPADKTYHLPARQGLARWYLRELDFQKALAIFNEFAQMSNVEQAYKAFGLAGQAVVLNRLGQYRESAARLAELFPLRDRLDSEMRSLVRLTFQKNRHELGETQATQQWDQWFQRTEPPVDSSQGEPAASEPVNNS